MKRLLTVIGALALGIVGLFMSLCGGGFLFADGGLIIFLLASLSVVIGIILLWRSYRIFRELRSPRVEREQ
jgi:hypothetical protein